MQKLPPSCLHVVNSVGKLASEEEILPIPSRSSDSHIYIWLRDQAAECQVDTKVMFLREEEVKSELDQRTRRISTTPTNPTDALNLLLHYIYKRNHAS